MIRCSEPSLVAMGLRLKGLRFRVRGPRRRHRVQGSVGFSRERQGERFSKGILSAVVSIKGGLAWSHARLFPRFALRSGPLGGSTKWGLLIGCRV